MPNAKAVSQVRSSMLRLQLLVATLATPRVPRARLTHTLKLMKQLYVRNATQVTAREI
jgi:hypothetical protein